MPKGKFITLEGGEGSGKSTSLPFIKDLLENQGLEVVMTHEPGGTLLAEQIRQLLLFPVNQEKIVEDTELLLMFASRAQHIAQVIRPAVNAGKWVVCSRFTDSTYAYQGGGRGVELARINQLESWVHKDFQPDLTLLFDLPVELGISRAKQRAKLDRIEQENIEFFSRVRAAYLQRAKQDCRYQVINAAQSISSVQEQLRQEIKTLVRRFNN